MTDKGYCVVFVGATAGIYNTWQECLAQVHGYPGAKHKKYSTRQEAEQAFREGPGDYYKRGGVGAPSWGSDLDSQPEQVASPYPIETAMCVHIKFKKSSIEYVYDWTFAMGKKELKRYTTDCPFASMSQNLAKFDALVNGLMYLSRKNLPYTIYTESDTAMTWLENVGNGQILYGSDKHIVQSDPNIYQLIKGRVFWLRQNPNHNRVKKWNVRDWGESPAATDKGYTL